VSGASLARLGEGDAMWAAIIRDQPANQLTEAVRSAVTVPNR
jgi:hypothetical protein